MALVDLDEAKGRQLEKELGPTTRFFRADVASYASQAEAFQKIWDKWHRIDALLANAGIVDKFSLYMLDQRGQNE